MISFNFFSQQSNCSACGGGVVVCRERDDEAMRARIPVACPVCPWLAAAVISSAIRSWSTSTYYIRGLPRMGWLVGTNGWMWPERRSHRPSHRNHGVGDLPSIARGLLDELASTNSVCASPANDIHASLLPLLPSGTYFLLELMQLSLACCTFGIPPPSPNYS